MSLRDLFCSFNLYLSELYEEGNEMKSSSDDDKLVFDYLRQLFQFAEEENIRFPGRSPEAALAIMDNIQRGQWVANAILALAKEGYKYIPLPTPEVCEILGLDELAKSLRASGEE